METIKLFLKGILIGIGKIIPGVSGSMIAISLGLYEKLLNSLSNIFKDFKVNALFLTKICLGMLVAIALISKVIIQALNNYYFPTMLLFIGLIVGGLPSIIKLAKEEINLNNLIFLIIPFVLFLLLDIITNNVNIDVKLSLTSAIWLGMLEAFTMIIPGISGTAIMIMLGVYEEILQMFSNFDYVYILCIFIGGLMIGVFLLSKVICYILDKYKIRCYYAVIGFVVSSIIILLKKTLIVEATLSTVITGIFLMLIGVFVSYKIE